VWIWNIKYLLNQLLRQFDTPKERLHISKEAQKLWQSIMGDEDINKYYYREKVTVKYGGAIIQEYKGSESESYSERTLKERDTFIFKDVFHLEHIVPVSIIIKKLTALDETELTYENVDRILSQIHICRMLKKEDRDIKEKYARPESYDEVIKKIYHKHGIYLVCE
jgi:hypothetical protein